MKNNNCIRYVPYLMNSIGYDHDFCCTCVKWWYLQKFFSVFKFLIFWVVRGVKGQKMVQNDKTFCLSCSISQEPYIIWLLLMLHMCKMIISLAFFFIFFKNGLEWQKIMFVALHISGTIHHVIVIYGAYV